MLKIKDIEGWNDYTIDNEGNVFSKRKNKYLKPTINKYGYCKITLQKNKKKRLYSVHRLVAEAFISNPDNLPQVNHIDGNKQNNHLENLEWCTAKHNMNEAVRIGLFENVKKIQSKNAKKNNLARNYIYANEAVKKKVKQYSANNELITEYESLIEASRNTGVCVQSICQVCKNKRKKAGGYIWHYA